MIVTHVIQHLGLGGAESFVVDLASAQMALGLNVDIVLLGPEPKLRDSIEVPVTHLRGRSGPDPVAVLRTRNHLRSRGTEVVHTHTFSGLIYGEAAATLARSKVVVFTDHASSSPRDFYGRRQRVANLMERRADAVVTFDDQLRRLITARSSLDERRVAIIPNGIRTGIEPTLPRHSARHLLEVSADDAIAVVAIGGLRAEKNYSLLVEVARLVHHVRIGGRLAPVEFRIIGEGNERSRLEQEISRGSVSNLRLLGPRDNARELLIGADLFINTSDWEGMPIAVLEAMDMGIPVIATVAGSLPTIVGNAGVACDQSAPALAAEVVRLAANHDLRQQLSERAKTRARDCFDISLSTLSYIALYGELLARANG